MTNRELAILGLVVEQPRHGYEIEQVIDERNMRNWTDIGFSSIYYVLKRLEGAGYVKSELSAEGSGGPKRRVYSATPQGRAAWREQSLEALARPQRSYPEFLLGLAALPSLDTDDVVAALEDHAAQLDQRRQQMHEAWERSGPDVPKHALAMFEYSEALISAELAWVRNAAERAARKELT